MSGNLPIKNEHLHHHQHLHSSGHGTAVKTTANRKLSFSATLHSTALLDVPQQSSTRRRLSNVSDVVTRKLSYTIGWKATHIPAQEIVAQGRCLCGQYIRRRLKRSGLFNKKLGLQRLRSIIGTSTLAIVREVFPIIIVLADELERMHPRLYHGVARQICRHQYKEFESPDTIILLLNAIARDLFRLEITWSKIVSLFAVAGGLSIDCVRQGHPEYLPKLLESISDIIEDELVAWINENGGWTGISNHVMPANNRFSPLEWSTIIIGSTFALISISFLFKFIFIDLLTKIIFNFHIK